MLTTLYRVDIAATAMGGAAPADGFIDHTPIENYIASGSEPTALANSLAKERGNLRYRAVREQLHQIANMAITNRVATGANADTAASTYSFTLEVERGDSVLSTRDESNNGAELTGAVAIKRAIARAMITPVTATTTYFDPTKTASAGNATTAARNPAVIATVTADKLTTTLSAAEGVITVTKIANT